MMTRKDVCSFLMFTTVNSTNHINMKKISSLLLCGLLFFTACNNSSQTSGTTGSDTTALGNTSDWKFGVALWTFHDVNFPQALDNVKSAGIVYIEPNTFHDAGPEFKDSMVGMLSPAGIEKLKAMIDEKGLKAKSVYVVGDSTIGSWKKTI